MEALIVLVVSPILIGMASELFFGDAKKASFAAALGSTLFVCLCVQALDPDGTWTWFAALLASPVPIAFALATVLFWYGRSQGGRRSKTHDA